MPDSIRGKTTTLALAATKTTITPNPISLGGVVISNLTAAVAWVQMYDKLAANVTVGTTKPDITISCPASASKEADLWDIKFDIGLVVACTTTAEGNGASSANVTFVHS